MLLKSLSKRLLCTTVLTSAVAFSATPTLAQDDDGDDEIIVVTGSRLNQANLTAPSPIFQVDAAEIDARGITRVEDLITTLPQAFTAQSSQIANGATGTAQINLRNLGATRTLVLMDGKRLPFGSAQSAAANVDMVPPQLIERVDIVTGGGSAVYGSDAVAGVVNFVLKKDFEGFIFDGAFGAFQDGNDADSDAESVRTAAALSDNPVESSIWDGEQKSLAVTFGVNTADGRGNVTAFLSYDQQNEIRQGARDHGACALGGSTGALSSDGVACIGSSTFRRFDANNGPSLFQLEDGTFIPRAGGPAQTFNFAPDNFYQRPGERFSIFSSAYYGLTDDIEAYMDFGYVLTRTDAQIAFSGTFGRPFEVNCDNPLLADSTVDGVEGVSTLAEAYCTPDEIAAGTDVSFVNFRRNVEGDPRNSNIELGTLRFVGGLRGTLFDSFDWDVYGQFARSSLTDTSENDLNFERLQDSLFLTEDDDGNVVCRSGNAGCVPYNVFQRGPNGESLVTDEAVDWIQGVGITTGNTEQYLYGATIGGDLGFIVPSASDPISAVVGAEYRRDTIFRRSDDVSKIPGGVGLTGVGGGTLDVDGEVRVSEFFGEVQVPLVQDRPFVQELGFSAAYRYSDYTTSGNDTQNTFTTDTYSAGLTWAPSSDLLLRAQYQRAVRAPNVFDLFLGQNTGLFTPSSNPNGLSDPCAGDFEFTDFDNNGEDDTPAPAATAEQCAFTGVTADQYGSISDNPARQLNQVTGGNPFLDPEVADTQTFGVVYTPSFIENLSVSLDYYLIELEDAIDTVPPAVSLDNCIETGDAQFCNLIVRDRFGSLYIDNSNFEGVQATNTNIAAETREGIDLAVDYRFGVGGFGSVNVNYIASYLIEDSQVPLPGADPVDCTGKYAGACDGAESPSFEFTHRALATWQTPFNIDVTGTWRYLSEVELEGLDRSDPDFTSSISDELEETHYFDVSAQWQATEFATFRFGVNNLLGQDPRLTSAAGNGPAGNGNTYPAIYDARGRFFFTGVRFEF